MKQTERQTEQKERKREREVKKNGCRAIFQLWFIRCIHFRLASYRAFAFYQAVLMLIDVFLHSICYTFFIVFVCIFSAVALPLLPPYLMLLPYFFSLFSVISICIRHLVFDNFKFSSIHLFFRAKVVYHCLNSTEFRSCSSLSLND